MKGGEGEWGNGLQWLWCCLFWRHFPWAAPEWGVRIINWNARNAEQFLRLMKVPKGKRQDKGKLLWGSPLRAVWKSKFNTLLAYLRGYDNRLKRGRAFRRNLTLKMPHDHRARENYPLFEWNQGGCIRWSERSSLSSILYQKIRFLGPKPTGNLGF